jgi:uncharacterized SAM-binding protein YcdF (DUF218 family)
MGRFLIRADEPSRADFVVVLGGDDGQRVLRAGELVQKGLAPAVLASGPSGSFGFHECELSIPWAVKHGHRQEWFTCLPHEADSTLEEAQILLPELRRRGARRVMVVTSTFHTRRARQIFHSIAPDLEIRVIAAGTEYFDPDNWWRSRKWRKTFLLEWLKTFAHWLGI